MTDNTPEQSPSSRIEREAAKMRSDLRAWLVSRRGYDEDPEFRARVDAQLARLQRDPDGDR